jgi:hypothetical protein
VDSKKKLFGTDFMLVSSLAYSLISFDCCLLHADFLFGLHLNLEDGSEMFLRNVI